MFLARKNLFVALLLVILQLSAMQNNSSNKHFETFAEMEIKKEQRANNYRRYMALFLSEQENRARSNEK